MMTPNIPQSASVYLLIPDAGLRKQFVETLPAYYQLTEFASLDDLPTQSPPDIDVVICHQDLLEGCQADVINELRNKCPGSRVLAYGPAQPMAIQIAALRLGARGYFDQQLSFDRLHEAIQLILHGEVWVERHVISGLIDEISQPPQISEEQKAALAQLSPKEVEVAKRVSHGATNKMIARDMQITERTVKAHLTTIFHKLDLADRLSLAILFRDLR